MKSKIRGKLKCAKHNIVKHITGDMKWFYLTIGLLTLYFLIFQIQFVLSGDVWAEAFPEYVNDAVNSGWGEVFAQGWAGYLTIIPSFLSKLYVSLHLPLGYIDYYLRFVTIVFTILCVSFISHPINRGLVKDDKVRAALALIFLLSVRHISALAFINVWYLGFVVVILVSLSNKKLSSFWEIIYTIFAVLIALSKSSLVLLPFIIYRAIKTKKYISCSIIAAAATVQTYFTVFAKNGYGNDKISVQPFDIIRDLFLGASTYIFKILHITPPNIFAIIILGLILVGICIFLCIKRNLWETIVLEIGLSISLYLYIFAPDNSFKNLVDSYGSLYVDTFKVQREFLIYFFIILIFGIFISTIITQYKNNKVNNKHTRITLTVVFIGLLLLINPLTKIDTTSPGVQSDISSFRHSLNRSESVCMPVPPTQIWYFKAMWFFQYKGGCYYKSTPTPINFSSFSNKITTSGINISISSTPKDELKTLIVLIKKDPNTKSGNIVVTDNNTMRSFIAEIPNNNEAFYFVNFKLVDLGPRDNKYSLTLKSSDNSNYYLGTFEKSRKMVTFSYFMGYPNIQQ